jgi:hypothetical protein
LHGCRVYDYVVSQHWAIAIRKTDQIPLRLGGPLVVLEQSNGVQFQKVVERFGALSAIEIQRLQERRNTKMEKIVAEISQETRLIKFGNNRVATFVLGHDVRNVGGKKLRKPSSVVDETYRGSQKVVQPLVNFVPKLTSLGRVVP